MKRLALCADDFGLSVAVDEGILALVKQGRLTDVSCLVGQPAWVRDAAALAATGVRCGLHLNLTEGQPLSSRLAARSPRWPSLPRLILQAHLRALPLPDFHDELRLQMTAFEQALGRPPDHLDGHQHVHHLPGIRGLVLDLARRRPPLRVRHTGVVVGPRFPFKRRLIAATGGRRLGTLLREQNLQQNDELLGVYDFKTTNYRRLMQRWLANLPERGGLIFCHPGMPGDAADPPDPIAAARVREFDYLSSDAFADDLAAAGVELGPSSKAALTAQGAERRTTSGG